MINAPYRARPRQRAALACLAGCLALLVASAVPVDAQSRYRVKSAERTKKEKSAPPGPHLFLVSLKSQRAALYANGALVAQTPISSGTASHPTPTGVFSVIQKNRHHRSNIYSGAPMPFMQRLTWSGIALHQGQLPGYPASHGCIRLPGDFASFLWRTTRLGARVIITHDEIAPSDISHAKLFQPKPRTSVADAAPALRRSIETDIAANTLTGTATDATAGDREGPDPEAARPDDAATGISAAALSDIPKSILASYFDTLEAKARKPTPAGPVSIFISRKDKQLYVRQGMQALFNVPVTLRDEQTAVGTHVFTALARTDGPGLRWIAVAIPSGSKAERRIAEPERRIVYRYDYYGRRIPVRVQAPPPVRQTDALPPPPAAAAVLDRLDLPQDVADRVSEYVTAGATLIVSDHGLSHETGAYTDFIVLTR
jgi:hypothetical protein